MKNSDMTGEHTYFIELGYGADGSLKDYIQKEIGYENGIVSISNINYEGRKVDFDSEIPGIYEVVFSYSSSELTSAEMTAMVRVGRPDAPQAPTFDNVEISSKVIGIHLNPYDDTRFVHINIGGIVTYTMEKLADKIFYFKNHLIVGDSSNHYYFPLPSEVELSQGVIITAICENDNLEISQLAVISVDNTLPIFDFENNRIIVQKNSSLTKKQIYNFVADSHDYAWEGEKPIFINPGNCTPSRYGEYDVRVIFNALDATTKIYVVDNLEEIADSMKDSDYVKIDIGQTDPWDIVHVDFAGGTEMIFTKEGEEYFDQHRKQHIYSSETGELFIKVPEDEIFDDQHPVKGYITRIEGDLDE